MKRMIDLVKQTPAAGCDDEENHGSGIECELAPMAGAGECELAPRRRKMKNGSIECELAPMSEAGECELAPQRSTSRWRS